MIRNQSSIFQTGEGKVTASGSLHLDKRSSVEDTSSKDSSRHLAQPLFGQGPIHSNDHSYDDQEESSSSDMGEEKLPFSKLARSPVRWSDLAKKRAVSPLGSRRKGHTQHRWHDPLNRFSIETNEEQSERLNKSETSQPVKKSQSNQGDD